MERPESHQEAKKLSKEKPKVIKQWMSKQAFWQMQLPPPKCINRPHYQVTILNEMHQFDLLYMPSDTLYGKSTDTSWLELMPLPDIKSRDH